MKKRLVFENNLVNVGLELEVDDDQDRMNCDERKLRYVKLHAPRKILLHMAEFMRTKMPIKECDIDTPDGTFTNFRPCCFTDNLELFLRERQYFTAPFSQMRPEMFITINTPTCFRWARQFLFCCLISKPPTWYCVDGLIAIYYEFGRGPAVP